MAVTRNRQNLRGYGLAQDPKVELDTKFVDDQNRRMYQKRGIEAQQEAQQKNFAQRDMESKATLLSKAQDIKSNAVPQINEMLDNEMKGIKDVAGDENVSPLDLQLKLQKYNENALVYNNLSEQAAAIALDVSSGKKVASNNLMGLLTQQETDFDFSGKSLQESLALFGGVLNRDAAPTIDPNDIKNIENQINDLTKQYSEGTLINTGATVGGKQAHKLKFEKPSALVEAGYEQSFLPKYDRTLQIMAENQGIDKSIIEQGIKDRLNSDLWGETVYMDAAPEAKKAEFKPTYKRGGGSNAVHSFSVTENNVTDRHAGNGIVGVEDKNWKTLNIFPTDANKNLKTRQVVDDKGNNVTAVITGVTNKDGKLQIVANKKVSQAEGYAIAAEKIDGFSDMDKDKKEAAYKDAVESGLIDLRSEQTELFDYEKNKHLVSASDKEVYKMLGDVRAYENPEQIKEDGFTYFAKQDGSDPMSIDELYKTFKLHKNFLNEKEKGNTFGEYIKKLNYLPQEGDVPNVDGAIAKKGSKEEVVEDDFSEFEVK